MPFQEDFSINPWVKIEKKQSEEKILRGCFRIVMLQEDGVLKESQGLDDLRLQMADVRLPIERSEV